MINKQGSTQTIPRLLSFVVYNHDKVSYFGFSNLHRCSLSKTNCSLKRRVPVSNKSLPNKCTGANLCLHKHRSHCLGPFPVAKVNILPLNMDNKYRKPNNKIGRKLNSESLGCRSCCVVGFGPKQPYKPNFHPNTTRFVFIFYGSQRRY